MGLEADQEIFVVHVWFRVKTLGFGLEIDSSSVLRNDNLDDVFLLQELEEVVPGDLPVDTKVFLCFASLLVGRVEKIGEPCVQHDVEEGVPVSATATTTVVLLLLVLLLLVLRRFLVLGQEIVESGPLLGRFEVPGTDLGHMQTPERDAANQGTSRAQQHRHGQQQWTTTRRNCVIDGVRRESCSRDGGANGEEMSTVEGRTSEAGGSCRRSEFDDGRCHFHKQQHGAMKRLIWSLLVLATVDAFLSHSSRCRPATARMGIKGFRSWFEGQFPDSVVAIPADGSQTDTFDHVLVDLNQLLHICVRKSRTDGHALTLLMKSLDDVIQVAQPTQTLVLAMDGAPSAAKLATQRKRRYATYSKTAWKLANLGKYHRKRVDVARKKRRLAGEVRTLCITPGTDFMRRAEQAIQYWAWQRLSSRWSVLHPVKIYLSPSTVPGEGEIKLLEWVYQKKRRGSIAILGGDSDLVLEGLLIPSKISRDVFVLLPDGNTRYLSVSIWETTRALQRMVPDAPDVMKLRMDLTLLLILNGNDYLPKLRGSSGFNKLFRAYLRTRRDWQGSPDEAYLVISDRLEFNLPFAIAYFEHLVSGTLSFGKIDWLVSLLEQKRIAPSRLDFHDEKSLESDRTSPLHHLGVLHDSGLIPSPMTFDVIHDGEIDRLQEEDEDETAADESAVDSHNLSGVEEEVDVEDDEEDDEMEDDELEERGRLLRLQIGQPDSDDFMSYEVFVRMGSPMKPAKQQLAKLALADIFGVDDPDELDESDDESMFGFDGGGYEWELDRSAERDVDEYLYGLLWNIQTYQDGICTDNGFNYGKRFSPTAEDIVRILKEFQILGKPLGVKQLRKRKVVSPLSPGLSCLAALPSSVKDLVPPPYSWLPDDDVERTYAECMDPTTNVFDMETFELKCENMVSSVLLDRKRASSDNIDQRVLSGEHDWTVICRSKDPVLSTSRPPEPFSDRLRKLRRNNRIQVYRVPASTEPKQGLPGAGLLEGETDAHDRVDDNDTSYKRAYTPSRRESKRRPRKKSESLKLESSSRSEPSFGSNKQKTIDIKARMKVFQILSPPSQPAVTLDGQTALACLKQLVDAGMVGPMSWNEMSPSPTEYASYDPALYELVTLSIAESRTDRAVLHENLEYEQDRHINELSRRSLRQHLASLALCDIVGPQRRWTEMTFPEMKEYLTAHKEYRAGLH